MAAGEPVEELWLATGGEGDVVGVAGERIERGVRSDKIIQRGERTKRDKDPE